MAISDLATEVTKAIERGRLQIGAGPALQPVRSGQVASDLVEGARQLRASRSDAYDDGDRDQSGNQAILDRGSARLVLEKALKELFHLHAPHFHPAHSQNHSCVVPPNQL